MMAEKDTTRTIASSAKSFFSGTAISRLFGLLREVLMAAAFGTAPEVAAFWMAFRFSNLLRRIFGEGALNAAFVPHFEILRKENPEKGCRFFYDLTIGVSLILLGLTVFAETLIGASLLFCQLESGTQDILRLTMLMLPALVFISLYALNSSLLNCEKKFFLSSVAPSFLNFVWMLSLLLFWKMPARIALERLSAAIVIAFGIQWLVTVPHVYSFLKKGLGNNFWQTKKHTWKEIGAILRPFSLAIVGVAAAQINTVLDALFARASDPEGPAYLWYSLRIQQLPLALFGLALTGAILPPIARSVTKQDKEQYKGFISYGFKQTILWMLPVTALTFVCSCSAVNVIYGHGAFAPHAVFKTAACLICYVFGLFPMTAILIFASAFYAKKNYKTPTVLAVIAVLLNVLLNALFVYVFKWGPISIANATTLTALFNCLGLWFFLKKENGPLFKGLFPFFAKILFASLFALLVTFLMGYFCFNDLTINWILGNKPTPATIFKKQVIQIILASTTFGFVFIVSAYVLKIREYLEFLPISRVRAKTGVS